MNRLCIALFASALLLSTAVTARAKDGPGNLQVGIGEVDITPAIAKDKPVYMAGFGQNRIATGVLDPLMARAIVFADGKTTVAMVSLDLVGLSYGNSLSIRKRLPEFSYVVMTCTHNHEGPDTIGLWGPSPFKSGVDKAYIRHVEDCAVAAIQLAKKNLKPTTAKVGTANDGSLLDDSREPYVKHDELVVIEFTGPDNKLSGLLVQWNCHPETLASENTRLSSDYVGYTVKALREKYQCPVVYLTGTVGGLMTNLHTTVKDDNGKELPGGSVEKTVKYGENLAKLAEKALAQAQAATLTPIQAKSIDVYLPLDNPEFLLAKQLGLMVRDNYAWTGDWRSAKPLAESPKAKRITLRSEVGWLKLGQLEVAMIPGEIYPELVLDKVQNPIDPGADFPDAPVEPAIYKQMGCPFRMIVGLANDEIGYIVPKRQWDVKAPFCYGRKKAQYGEGNSLGSETAPILCEAFKELVKAK
ncbi:hypothetical protein BH10PLA2_BH10PLA2_28580 [soil metagenome]